MLRTMKANTTKISAIHDWHLQQTLSELGLLVPLEQGLLRCKNCEKKLVFDSVGGILVLESKQYALVCDNALCISTVSQNK